MKERINYLKIGKRHCSICNKVLELNSSNFFRGSTANAGFSRLCKKCHTKDGLDRNRLYKNQARLKYSSIKSGCKKRRVNIDITKDEFISWYDNSEKRCVYCDITEDLLKKINWHALVYSGSRTLSVDRIDNSRDYTLDNICLACSLCNYMKGTLLSKDEMIEIGQKYVKPKWLARITGISV